MSNIIPYGYCHCGCGSRTPISQHWDDKHRYKIGEPSWFIMGHQQKLQHRFKVYIGPPGLCLCGCGQISKLSQRSKASRDTAKGFTVPFVKGHKILRPSYRVGEIGRICEECARDLPHASFTKLSHICRGCRSDIKRAQKLRSTRKNGQRYRAEHRDQISKWAASRRAKLARSRQIEVVDRAAIIARDNNTCYLWCGRKLELAEIELDHVIPISRGGSHTADNLRVACRRCNRRKWIRLLSELPDLPVYTSRMPVL